MFAEERHVEIEKILLFEGKVKVKELSTLFSVTEDCIRKDLKLLENKGIPMVELYYQKIILSKEK